MTHKKQHFVTKAYLRAWCDPESDEGSYVWVVSKREKVIHRRSPKNLFSETDFYTFVDSEGNRNVDFELKLQKNETHFLSIRHHKINRHKVLDDKEMLVVSTFIANMFARVKKQRDQQIEMWQELMDNINKLPDEVVTVLKDTPAYAEINNIRKQPILYNIEMFAKIAVPFFSKMRCEILETEAKPGFITSDNPCFMIDPALYGPNPPRSWYEVFSSPTFEVLFPISPKQLISLKHIGRNQYRLIDELPNSVDAIDAFNKIIIDNSEEFIVLNQRDFKTEWFERS
ncbi:MAG TPA: DUF4238 domain-containing protein [Anaerolineales bacterium]|nr:DUF4238 domain-containing protein [Anaerolineales bacterium]